MRLRPVEVAALFVCLLAISTAWAGPLRMTGYDTASMGQGGGEMVWGRGLGVLYSNPALLADVAQGFGLSFFFMQPSMRVELMERPTSADVPITLYDSDVGIAGANLDRPLPTAELRIRRADRQVDSAQSYLGIGVAHKLFFDDLRLGLALQVPTGGLASGAAHYPDEREQYFSNTVHMTRFGEWSQVLSLLLGLSYRPLPWLSLGVSIEGGLHVGAALDMYIPEATVQEYAQVNAAIDAKPTARWIVGISARPLPWLGLGLVWRDRRYAKVDADALLNLWNYHEAGDGTIPKRVKQRHRLALDFEPQELTLAAGVRLETLFAQLAVTWNHWADYIDTHHRRAQQNAVWDPDAKPDMRFAFSDTFSVGLGLGYEYLAGLTVTAGGAWRPSPVPGQVGRTNYADADLFNVSLGHRLDFGLAGEVLRAEVALQLWIMSKTSVHKDPTLVKDEFPDDARTLIAGQPMPEAEGLQTNNPGFPGYTVGGWSLSAALSVTYLF